ncbi:hypothetical protein [Mycobacterium sp. 1274761.0]|uniref:hypothetical protein n=1 Tax=Mycobacterium sp. 1274761.0 TaxID=1834077 RepID=UPI0007FC8E8A|nr:hypothetical protein [Mycobacterium sp. 1274761.0]OBK78673.1 hypothetical protein A5651_01720 [Mycobacterium sp. 1274761.0]
MTRDHLIVGIAAGFLAVGAAVASAATAAAEDPPPPADPAPPAAPPTGLIPPAGTLQNFLPAGGMAPGSGYDFLLGQAPMPTAQGGQPTPAMVGADGQPVGPTPQQTILDTQAIDALKPTNFTLDRQGQQSMYSHTPAPADAPPPNFFDNTRGAHGIWNYGMGRLTTDQLGQPLPGTAPPPGTNIPMGVVNLDDPSAPPPPQPPFPFTAATPPPAG